MSCSRFTGDFTGHYGDERVSASAPLPCGSTLILFVSTLALILVLFLISKLIFGGGRKLGLKPGNSWSLAIASIQNQPYAERCSGQRGDLQLDRNRQSQWPLTLRVPAVRLRNAAHAKRE